MIITRTPFRVSLFGGGSDMPWYFNNHNSLVVGMAIDKYCYVVCRKLPKYFSYKSRISYSKIELVEENEEIEHKAIKKALEFYDIKEGIEISHISDIPAKTGIGSSSSFAVGLIHAINAMNYRMMEKEQLALESTYLEQNLLAENVGCQDQIWAAHGGLNIIRFSNKFKNNYSVKPIIVSPDFEKKLLDSMLLIYSNDERISSNISGQYLTPVLNKEKELNQIVEIAEESINYFKQENIVKIGKLLHKAWEIKKGMHKSISTNNIDNIYNECISSGAIGGKLLGAGGGGFLLIIAEPGPMEKIKQKFKKFIQIPVGVDYCGSKLLYINK